jgi:hypothetical protein
VNNSALCPSFADRSDQTDPSDLTDLAFPSARNRGVSGALASSLFLRVTFVKSVCYVYGKSINSKFIIEFFFLLNQARSCREYSDR